MKDENQGEYVGIYRLQYAGGLLFSTIEKLL